MATSKITTDTYYYNEVNFKNTPTTYLDDGRIFIIKYGRIVLLRFVGIHIRNSPTAEEAFYVGIPRTWTTISGVLARVDGKLGAQHILLYDNTIHNYFTVDSQRGSDNPLFCGEIVYFSNE